MLGELAITPDVYREDSFLDAAAAARAWEQLREPILHECLLRDLYDGQMIQILLASVPALSPRGKELLKKSDRRRRQVPRIAESVPQTDIEWCAEAVASAHSLSLDCIVTAAPTKNRFKAEPLVCDAAKITGHSWWENRGPSVRLDRKTSEYLRVLDRVLLASNSLVFIDPHLDPTKPQYSEFWQLLACCHRPVSPVRVEIHRICSEGSGSRVEILSLQELRQRFANALLPKLSGINIKLKLVVWPKFHDRFLISDLIGISLSNGFDVSKTPDDISTWARLSRRDRDDIQRQFDYQQCPSGPNLGSVDLLP